MDKWMTLTALARMVNVPESSARRYTKLFPQFFPRKRVGRLTLYLVNSGDILKRISDLFSEGYQREQVEEALGAEAPRTIEAETERMPLAEAGLAGTQAMEQFARFMGVMANQKKELSTIRRDFTQVRSELDRLRRKYEAQSRVNATYKKAIVMLGRSRDREKKQFRELREQNDLLRESLEKLTQFAETTEASFRRDIDDMTKLVGRLLQEDEPTGGRSG